MTFRIIGAFALLTALAGCSNGVSLNPLDWFGPKEDSTVVVLEPAEGWGAVDRDYRGAIPQVTSLQLERGSGGYIVRAEGVPPTLGYWNAELVAENDGKPVNGVLTYEFRIAPPPFQNAQGTPQQKIITVATFVSDVKLASANAVAVKGATNVLTARR